MTITATQKKKILKYWPKLTNRQLAHKLGLALTTLRTMCYALGLKRMDLQYWTKEQIAYLKKNYKKCGDKELAELFTALWPKPKGWTLKHIEKKRNYLNLHRTPKQLAAIKQKAVVEGVYKEGSKKTWATRGEAKEGEIRMWLDYRNKPYPVMKINGAFRHWAKWKWEKHRGPVPKGYNIIFKDGDGFNLRLSNLMKVSDAELSRRNSKISSQGCSDNYVAGILSHHNPELREALKKRPHLLELKRQQLFLNRQIKNHEQHS